MKVSELYNIENTNFCAKKIAHAKNNFNSITTHLDLFKLETKDLPYLKKLLKKDFFEKDSFSNLSKEKLKTWKDILKFSLYNAMEKENTSYLATTNQKPCGLISMQGKRHLNLINLVSIPIDNNKKANLVGKTLLYKALQDGLKNNSKKISLEAVKNSPGNPVKLYESLGFKINEESTRYIQMSCNNENIKQQLNLLKKTVNLKDCKPKSFDLDKFLD